VFKHLLEYHPRIEGNIFVFVARKRRKDDLVLPTEVLDRWQSRADLATEKVIEYLYNVLARLEVES
jgi:hypothetical protein